MIRLIDKGTDWRVETEVVGLPVYLDNYSIIDLAKRSPQLRTRFLTALRGRGTLLFSLTNAIEVTGPQGKSSEAVRSFLSEVGPHWIPVDLDPSAVIRREKEGHPAPPVSTDFVTAYAHQRLTELEVAGVAVDTADPTLFDLGKLLDWTQDHRAELRANADAMDASLGAKLAELRALYDGGNRIIDRSEDDPLLPGRRADYVMGQMLRMMIQEAKSHGFQPHDALDLCHAVMAISYGLMVTLDKKWWRRAGKMRHRDRLARVYYGHQLEQFVSDFESARIELGETAAVSMGSADTA
jgi:hypothetical protein